MKAFVFATLGVLIGCATNASCPKSKAAFVATPKAVIERMHQYCKSLGAGYVYATSEGDVGGDASDFACRADNGNGEWYWIKWSDVKP
jgi:hypothetical protein